MNNLLSARKETCAPKGNSYRRVDYWILFSLIVVGVLIRLHFLVIANFPIDSDEAIVGIMAKHILQGRGIPTFYYGQHYMGSLEALSVAVSFWVFGDSHVVLRLVPLAWYVILLIIFYRLCWENIGAQAARVATALMAIAPAAFIEWSTKARGGFIEIIVLAAFSLLFTFRFYRTGQLKPAIISSFILGVGWWTNNQIVYFFPATALVFVLAIVNHSTSKLKTFGTVFFSCLAAFLLGGAPYWIYNLKYNWASFGMFSFAEDSRLNYQVKGMFELALPMLFGGKRFWTPGDIYPQSSLLSKLLYGVTVLFAIFAVFSARLAKVSKIFVISCLLTILTTLIIFSTSQFGSLFSAPRYLLPLYLVIFPLVGVIAASLVQSRIGRLGFVAIFTMFNFASAYAVEIAIPGEPIVYNDDRVSHDHSELITFLKEQNITYVRTNYWIGYRLAFETNEQVTFKLFQPPREPRIRVYEESAPKFESYINTPIVASIGQSPIIRRALKVLNAPFKEAVKSGYFIFYDIHVDGFGGFKKIPNAAISVEASIKNELVSNMFDGDFDTRWGSGKPQDPSMRITVRFDTPRAIRLVELDTGKFKSDTARGIEIYGRISDQETPHLIVGKADARSIAYFLDNEMGTGILLPANPLKEITIAQVGKDTIFDWSIAELEVFE